MEKTAFDLGVEDAIIKHAKGNYQAYLDMSRGASRLAAVKGGIGGSLIGAGTGAVSAGEGRRGEGAFRGAVAGGTSGAAIGGLGRAALKRNVGKHVKKLDEAIPDEEKGEITRKMINRALSGRIAGDSATVAGSAAGGFAGGSSASKRRDRRD